MNEGKSEGPYLVFNVGCIECGVPSDVVGIYSSEIEAYRIAGLCGKELYWRHGGQNTFEVFDLSKGQSDEYRDVINNNVRSEK